MGKSLEDGDLESRLRNTLLLLALFPLEAAAQTAGNWTRQIPQTFPPPRYRHSLAFDSARAQVVLFGGIAGSVVLNDTWVFDGSNWTQESPQTSPPGGDHYAMAYDAARRQIVLFGSATLINPVSDTWVWDGVNWTHKFPQASPPQRDEFALAYDSARGQIVLFGGVDAHGFTLGDTWVWDGVTWTQKAPQTSPLARDEFALAFDSAHGQVVLFGGMGNTGANLSDTWTWNGGSAALVPALTSVISASGFGGSSSVSPGDWVEIYGSNLSSTTRGWGGADFNGNNAPTVLDGVQVTAAAQKAFVNYISASPGQINAQLPSNIPTGGTVQLTVTNGTVTSAPFNVTVKSTQPGLLAPASFLIGGKQYSWQYCPKETTYFRPGQFREWHPAKHILARHSQPTASDLARSYQTSLPGQIVTHTNQLALPLQILFGQKPAQLPYAGLAPGFVGLYQFNVVVPAMPDNDIVPFTFNLGGVAGTQTLYTAVHQ